MSDISQKPERVYVRHQSDECEDVPFTWMPIGALGKGLVRFTKPLVMQPGDRIYAEYLCNGIIQTKLERLA